VSAFGNVECTKMMLLRGILGRKAPMVSQAWLNRVMVQDPTLKHALWA
jgi:hypothetical protein